MIPIYSTAVLYEGPLMSELLLGFATMFEKNLPLVFVVVGGICGWLLGVSHLVLGGGVIYFYTKLGILI